MRDGARGIASAALGILMLISYIRNLEARRIITDFESRSYIRLSTEFTPSE